MYVDSAAIGRRLFILPGEIQFLKRDWKSAEVIVVGGNELHQDVDDSQANEGLNIELFQMLHGVFIQPCVKRNREKSSKKK